MKKVWKSWATWMPHQIIILISDGIQINVPTIPISSHLNLIIPFWLIARRDCLLPSCLQISSWIFRFAFVFVYFGVMVQMSHSTLNESVMCSWIGCYTNTGSAGWADIRDRAWDVRDGSAKIKKQTNRILHLKQYIKIEDVKDMNFGKIYYYFGLNVNERTPKKALHCAVLIGGKWNFNFIFNSIHLYSSTAGWLSAMRLYVTPQKHSNRVFVYFERLSFRIAWDSAVTLRNTIISFHFVWTSIGISKYERTSHLPF